MDGDDDQLPPPGGHQDGRRADAARPAIPMTGLAAAPTAPRRAAPRYPAYPQYPRPAAGRIAGVAAVPRARADALDAAPGAPARWQRPAVVTSLGAVAAATTWLPWFKLPAAGMFELSGSGPTRSLSAWKVPAAYLWSYRSGDPGDLKLGWVVLVLVVGMVALAWRRAGGASAVSRALGGMSALAAALFVIQTIRSVDAATTVRVNGVALDWSDVTGLGVYALLVVSIAAMLVPGD
ncbi:MAG: hypothetical protein ACXVJ7_04890 [Acidimicrobiia bacterium]